MRGSSVISAKVFNLCSKVLLLIFSCNPYVINVSTSWWWRNLCLTKIYLDPHPSNVWHQRGLLIGWHSVLQIILSQSAPKCNGIQVLRIGPHSLTCMYLKITFWHFLKPIQLFYRQFCPTFEESLTSESDAGAASSMVYRWLVHPPKLPPLVAPLVAIHK